MIPEGLSKGRRRRERKDTEAKKEQSGGGERRGRRQRVMQGHCARWGAHDTRAGPGPGERAQRHKGKKKTVGSD